MKCVRYRRKKFTFAILSPDEFLLLLQSTQSLSPGLYAPCIISGLHPKDVPFVCEFWWGTYGLGRIKARKEKQISATAAVDVFLSHEAKVNKPIWAWDAVRRCVSTQVNSCVTCQVRRWETLFEPILQCVSRYIAACL